MARRLAERCARPLRTGDVCARPTGHRGSCLSRRALARQEEGRRRGPTGGLPVEPLRESIRRDPRSLRALARDWAERFGLDQASRARCLARISAGRVSRVSVTVADELAIVLGTHVALLYPAEY